MIHISEKSRCTGCGACVNICPHKCIKLTPDREGFLYPVVDATKCIDCKLCEKVCPFYDGGIDQVCFQKAYAAYANDPTIRLQSSSGGIFPLLAEYVIQQNGVVFGAAMNSDLQVEHICINSLSTLKQLKKSKYVQSCTKDTFLMAKSYLEEGKMVLYTGTPCQIAGLKNYLKKEYENLFTQDLICYGVPSPLLWKLHTDYYSKENGVDLKSVEFRNKSTDGKNYVLYHGENTDEYKIASEDIYTQTYYSNICLRPSCYDCRFKNKNRSSDITLGDFWGIAKVVPEMDNGSGTSLVICNTKKGIQLFSCVSDKIAFKEVDVESATMHNPMANYSNEENPKRKEFFRYLQNHSYKKTISHFAKLKKKSVKALRMKQDFNQVKSEKGSLFAVLWLIKNIIKY